MKAEENEQLLTKDEIAIVERKAKYSLLMHNPFIIGTIGKSKFDVERISPIHKLIFIKGDEFTGYQHIVSRHWQFQDAYSKTQNLHYLKTSKFSQEMLPNILHCADCIYHQQNEDTANQKPDVFDVFIGSIPIGSENKYKLILYKDSKIIHTFFPVEKGKQKHKFRKGKIQIKKYGFIEAIGLIPYYDIDDILRYTIIVTVCEITKTEKCEIGIYESEKFSNTVHIKTQPFVNSQGLEHRLMQWNYSNLSKIEKAIEYIHKKLSNVEPPYNNYTLQITFK